MDLPAAGSSQARGHAGLQSASWKSADSRPQHKARPPPAGLIDRAQQNPEKTQPASQTRRAALQMDDKWRLFLYERFSIMGIIPLFFPRFVHKHLKIGLLSKDPGTQCCRWRGRPPLEWAGWLLARLPPGALGSQSRRAQHRARSEPTSPRASRQLQSHVSPDGHTSRPVISNLGTRGHLGHTNDSHFPADTCVQSPRHWPQDHFIHTHLS